MKKILALLFVFCLGQTLLKAENTVIDTIKTPKGSSIVTDNLGNLFVITPTNDIIKYDKNGLKLATANFKVLGNISSIDASNAFEIYVFYRDQNKIIFLDNLLNLRGECDMESIGVSQIACIARSSDNQIWLFDMSDLKLKKYSKDLKLLLESTAFNTYPIGNEINPMFIKDINSSVFILNNQSVLEFDIFANFNKTVLKDTLSSFQYLNERIIYLKNNQIQVYYNKSFRSEVMQIELPKNTLMLRIEKERLFILQDEYVILQTFSE